jgi:hypothetical protein
MQKIRIGGMEKKCKEWQKREETKQQKIGIKSMETSVSGYSE